MPDIAKQDIKFDLVISLDKDSEAVSLAELIKVDEKYGCGLNIEGRVCPFNKEAEYYFLLGVDNDLKFYKNKCDRQETCMDKINLDDIAKAAKDLVTFKIVTSL